MFKNNRQKHRFWLLIAFAVVTFIASHYSPQQTESDAKESTIAELFSSQQSNQQVQVTATVSRLLSDDTEGSRHQRFILTLDNGITVLVAHNIDLAPKVTNLKIGDELTVYGEYEWNQQGGVIHWTHHDPANKHIHGWIRHHGVLYQ